MRSIKLGVFERLDFVEQRHDEDRRELAEDDADDEERGGGDQPPVVAGVPDDPEQADVERGAEQDRQHVAQRPVAEPAAQRLVAEAELVFDDVAGIKRERQRDEDVQPMTMPNSARRRSIDWSPASGCEAGQPGVDAAARRRRPSGPGR